MMTDSNIGLETLLKVLTHLEAQRSPKRTHHLQELLDDLPNNDITDQVKQILEPLRSKHLPANYVTKDRCTKYLDALQALAALVVSEIEQRHGLSETSQLVLTEFRADMNKLIQQRESHDLVTGEIVK